MRHIASNGVNTIEANSEDTNFPVEQMLDEHPKRVWKAASGIYSTDVVLNIPGGCSDIMFAGTNAGEGSVSNIDAPTSMKWAGSDTWGGLAGDVIAAIDKVLVTSSDVTDVFVYDTTKDSDGGAWRDRMQTASWYTETLNTATRGATRGFPEVVVIVAETDTVTIYDATVSTLPMWMVFVADRLNFTAVFGLVSAPVTAVFMLNGLMAVAAESSGGALSLVNFIQDVTAVRKDTPIRYYSRDVEGRNDNVSLIEDGYYSYALANKECNDVAMTIMLNAPIDSITGIAVPTIAVATAGGVSVIDGPDGIDTVANSSGTSGRATVSFYGGRLYMASPSVTGIFRAIDTEDLTTAFTGDTYSTTSIPAVFGNDVAGSNIFRDIAQGTDRGLVLLKENITTPAEGMVNYVTKDWISGWMQGDIKLASLASTIKEGTGSITVGTEVDDRSVNDNPMIVVGTLAKTAVAAGSELVAYEGFSTIAHLEQAYNADLDFGTGDFYVMGWFSNTGTVVDLILDRRDVALVEIPSYRIITQGDGTISASVIGNHVPGSRVVNDGLPHFVVLSRKSGVAELHLDGVSEGSAVATGDVDNAAAITTIGASVTGASALGAGSLSLWRVGAGAPSAEQILEIYNTEKELFEDNSKCTIQSTSDHVTAIDFDKEKQLLRVGTSNIITTFLGVRVVDTETLTAATINSISATFGRFSVGTSVEAKYLAPLTYEITADVWATLPDGITGSVIQDSKNKTLWIELSEAVIIPCSITITLTGPGSETLYAGIATANTVVTYGGDEPNFGLTKSQIDYSVRAENSNGSQYYKKRDIVRTFNQTVEVSRAESRNFETFFQNQGYNPTGWKLVDIDSNDYVVFGKMDGAPVIVDSYPYTSEVTFKITEVV